MHIASIPDYRRAAQRELPRFLFDYIDGGALAETTLGRNVADLEAISLNQRVLTGVGQLDLTTELFGETLSMPVILAPVGLAGLAAHRGEVLAARAAHAAGVPFTLSTVSVCTVEEVKRGTGAAMWFQLYLMRDRGFLRDMLARAWAAGCRTLVFTVDMPVPGIRYRDARSGLSAGAPLARQAKLFSQALARPAWTWKVGLMGRPHTLGHVASVMNQRAGIDAFWAWASNNFDPSVSWKDIDAVRAEWPGALVIKGVMDPDDARAAQGSGADGVIVSNHGGRQLEGAPSSISALPAVVEAVGGQIPVLMDGGVRNGADVVRAVATGAAAVLIGRPWAWALGARGEAGVAHVLAILEKEIRTTMALIGASRAADIGAVHLAAAQRLRQAGRRS